MRWINRSTVAAVLGALVAALVVVTVPGTASGLPGGCTSTWTGAVDTNWTTSGNWTSGVPNGATAVACIGNGVSSLGATVTVKAVHLDSATLTIQAGGGLFANGPDASQWGPDSIVEVNGGRLGGTADLVTQGTVRLTSGASPATLTSINASGGAAWGGTPGKLFMISGGELRVTDLGLAVLTRYEIHLHGGHAVVESGAWITADYGTTLGIAPGSSLLLEGDGGYYQGFPVSGQPLSAVVNYGTVGKTGGGGTSVVDANYVQGPSGQVVVNCCGTVALPDKTPVSGQVSPGWALATGTCGGQATTICGPTVNPALDAMSVRLAVPAANPQAAGLQLQELGVPPLTVDSKTIGNEVYAHADQLAVNPANPATLTLRYSQADVMNTPLEEVQVAHTDDAGHQTQIPDCISGTLPTGVPSCVVRPVTRDAQNTYVTVLTTQTSRWHLRRNKPGEPGEQTAPSPPQGAAAKLAVPDGSAVSLAWSPPASDGGAAVTAYRVYRDGTSVATTTGNSVVVNNPGAGAHTFAVSAVNGLGEGPRASDTITLAPLSKPRNVKDVRGAAGGKRTAGAKWKPPAAAGGLAITGYKVAVFKKNGTKVDTKVMTASKLKHLFKLKKGRYFFKVRARNGDGWGPWSKPTDLVRPR